MVAFLTELISPISLYFFHASTVFTQLYRIVSVKRVDYGYDNAIF